ncbi:MAG: hypothetical protein SV765_10100 [Pseudomonadota bacterium]|nr:hypothetical protein [Pseudomonadota bacterium]
MPEVYQRHRNFILFCTFVLCLPALAAGLMGDDYLHYALLNADIPIAKPDDLSLFGLFSFINGDPERNRLLMDYSLIPWWTYAEMKYAFWRPLSEAFHWLDHRLWPHSPWLMHLHSILWYLLAVYLVSRLYRHFMGPTSMALLALLLYALDSTHGFTVSWISNRNALHALVFALASMLLYVRWRDSDHISYLLGSLLTLALALLSAELGISIFGYIGAYALFLDRRGPVRGVLATIPHGLLIVTWWLIYKAAGFGAAHASGYYVDPAVEPLTFIAKAITRLPVLMASQWGIVPAEFYSLTGGDNTAYVIGCAIYLLIIIPVLLPQLRDKSTGFWFFGMLFCLLPVLAAAPYDRLLLFPGIGASALLARFIHTLWIQKIRPRNLLLKSYSLAVFGLLVMLHLFLSPVLLPVMSYSTKIMADQVDLTPTEFPGVEDIANKRLVLFSPPLASSVAIAAARFYRQEPIPQRIWTVTSRNGEMTIRKTGPNEVTVEREAGFISGQVESAVRDLARYPYRENDAVMLSGLSIRTRQVDEKGRPHQLQLEFDAPVSADDYLFLQWNKEDKAWHRIQLQ